MTVHHIISMFPIDSWIKYSIIFQARMWNIRLRVNINWLVYNAFSLNNIQETLSLAIVLYLRNILSSLHQDIPNRLRLTWPVGWQCEKTYLSLLQYFRTNYDQKLKKNIVIVLVCIFNEIFYKHVCRIIGNILDDRTTVHCKKMSKVRMWNQN